MKAAPAVKCNGLASQAARSNREHTESGRTGLCQLVTTRSNSEPSGDCFRAAGVKACVSRTTLARARCSRQTKSLCRRSFGLPQASSPAVRSSRAAQTSSGLLSRSRAEPSPLDWKRSALLIGRRRVAAHTVLLSVKSDESASLRRRTHGRQRCRALPCAIVCRVLR